MNAYRYTLILAIACLYSAKLFAQREQDFKLDTNYLIGQQNQCRSLKVVDLRENKENVGYIKTGAFNRNANLVTDKPFGEFLSAHFNAITKDHKGNDELVLVLYHFHIEDRANGEEIGTFYFDGDFYRNNNGQYMLIGKVDSLYEVNAGMDVTWGLIRVAQEQVNEALSSYAKLDIKTIDAPVYTETQLADSRKQQNLNYPIYRAADNFKKGIYYTLEQFINNTPVDTPFTKSIHQLSTGRKSVVIFYLNSKGKKGKPAKEETYFAAYDGKDWAISTGRMCVPMEYKNGEFYAAVPLRGLKDKATNMAMGAALGGVIGGAIAGATSQGKVWRTYKAKFDPATKGFRPMKRI